MDDEKIIELFFARSEQAISELDAKYGKVCFQLSHNILNNRLDAEECVNDAYLGTWNAIPPQRPNPLLPFVCVIVRRYSIMRHRANTAMKRNGAYDIAMAEIEHCLADPVTVEGTVEAKRLAHIIEDFLDTLTEENRVIFLRRYWFADSYADIAEHTGFTEKKFDILLVFMFDRIGRIADETPFVVEWFVKNGIRVWSTQEGEQRFDNHTDKLTNYIRFWQADGESEKTSIRTKTALGQLVEDGGFKGGLAPYGYDLVKSGRFNKRKHEVFELAVNEAEAAVVRIIFDKYVHEGFGAQRIATYLNNLGYRARSGKKWHHASIRGIICNPTYTGVLRSGESRSQVLPHLQIISPELFEAAQHIRTNRANSAEQERHVPLNTRGQSLLAGNVYCGHCGSRLALTTNGKAYPCKEDPGRVVKRVRYICYGKTRKQTECDGQTGYTAHILDGIIDKVVRQVFERMKSIPKSEIVNTRYRAKMEERQALLKGIKTDYAKATAELDMLRAEVIKSIRGESAFSQELLGSLVKDAETKCLEVQQQLEAAQQAYEDGQAMLAHLDTQYDDIVSWADMYDTASMEAKKMIVNCLIKRVDVYRDYKLHIDFNIDFEQFSAGLDIVTIAA